MTDDQKKLSDRFWQAKRIKDAANNMIALYRLWRTYIKDPIPLDPKLFAAELHHLADKIEIGELKL